MTAPPTSPPPAAVAPLRSGERAALFALIVLGLLVRGTRINESLWYDEVAAWRDYASHGPRWIITTYNDPANHVAHSVLSWASMEWFGDALGAEIGLRVPALLFSLLLIPAAFSLGRHAGSTRLGFIAAALAALAPVAVLEAADARGYSMMMFVAAAATAQMITALDGRRATPWVIYAALAAFGIWAHIMTVFVFVGHGIWLAGCAVRARGTRVRLIAPALGLLGAALLTLALYAPIIDDILRVRRVFAGADSAGPSVFGPEGVHTLLQLGGSWTSWAAAPGLVLAGAGAVRIARDRPARRVALLLLLGLPALFVAVLIGGTWTYARFALFTLPGGLIMIALGLDMLRPRRAAFFAAFGILLAGWAGDMVTRPPRQPLRDAVRSIEARQAPGDRVVIVGLRHAVLEAYTGGLDASFSLLHGADLEEQLDERDPAWVVVMYPNSVASDRYDLLTARGYTPWTRLPGWIDWTNGDVVIWGKGKERRP